ncbi:hypothetical protein McaMca56_002096 [Microsporum canis]
MGREFVQQLGLANTRDLVTLTRWNTRYKIHFMRISSEMFPFASHSEYGYMYKLSPLASEALAEVGCVAVERNHHLTVYPGQVFLTFELHPPQTAGQEVIESSIKDLGYHAEMLSLLKLPPQMDRDAVMILHMGGTFGDKKIALTRFRETGK